MEVSGGINVKSLGNILGWSLKNTLHFLTGSIKIFKKGFNGQRG